MGVDAVADAVASYVPAPTSSTHHTTPDALETIRTLAQKLQRLALDPSSDHGHTVARGLAELGLFVQQDVTAQHAAVDAGVLVVLTKVLDSHIPSSIVERRVALATTLLLFDDNAATQAAAATTDLIRCLVALLVKATSSVRILALVALRLFVHGRDAHQASALAAGAVHELVYIVRDGYGAEHVEAMRVLASLCDGNDAARALVTEKADAIGAVLLPDNSHEEAPLDQSALARAVLEQFLSHCDRLHGDVKPRHELEALVARLHVAMPHGDTRSDHERWLVLLALEELKELFELNKTLVLMSTSPTFQTIVADLIPLCVDQLRAGRPTEHKYAGQILSLLMDMHIELRCVVADAVPIEALIEMLADNDRRASTRVLFGVLDLSDRARLEAFAAGVIPALVGVLGDGRLDEKLMAAGALGCIVRDNDAAQTEALHAGALTLLVELISNVHDSLQHHVVEKLQCLVDGHAAAQDAFMQTGGVSLLVRLLGTGTSQTRVAAIQTIAGLVRGHVCLQAAFTNAGALEALVPLFVESDDEHARVMAGWTMLYLAEHHATNKASVVESPALPRFVQLLRVASSKDEQRLAAAILGVLALGNAAAQAPIRDAGAIKALVRLIECSTGIERVTAATTLAVLVDDCEPNQVKAIDAGAFAPLAAMLRSDADDWQAAAATLSSVFDIVAGGAIDARVLQSFVEILRFGGDALQYRTLVTLLTLVTDEAKAQLVRKTVPLSVLLDLMKSTDAVEIKMLAVVTIVGVTEHEVVSRSHAIEAGVVQAIVELIQGELGLPRDTLLSILACLVCDDDAANHAAVDAGAVTATRFLMTSSDDDNVKRTAAAAFASLSSVQDDAIAVGVLTPLRELLSSQDVNDRSLAATALAALVRDHPANQDAVTNATDVVPMLVAMLSVPTESTKLAEPDADVALEDPPTYDEAQRDAACALANLTDRNPVTQAAVAHAGAAPLLVALVRSATDSFTSSSITASGYRKTQAAAMRALRNLLESQAIDGDDAVAAAACAFENRAQKANVAAPSVEPQVMQYSNTAGLVCIPAYR